MVSVLKVLSTCLIFCGVFEFTMSATTQEKAVQSLEALTNGSNKFAINLYQTLIKQKPNENLIVSPTSLMMVLSLAYIGSKGQTAKEIADALGLPSNSEDVLVGYNQLIQDLRNPVLKLVNKIFADSSLQLKEEFQKQATEYFLSAAQNVDFLHNAEVARQTINTWVEDNTNNKIKDLLAPGVVDASTRLVLTNAIHFKANWKLKFDPTETSKENFYVTPDTTVKVDMMHTKDKFGFKHHMELEAKMLQLPYEGDDFRLIVILPDKPDGLANVESKLQTLNLQEEFSSFRKTTVLVGMPKFKMESTIDLEDILIQLGMPSMFSEADFSGIAQGENLQVSKVVQKAFIEVNEEGTEAAAATAAIFGRSGGNRDLFYADHPFLLLILHRNNNVLFIGTVKKPAVIK
uniref:Venom serpin 3 n=1 Tax=Lethocerus distinctifemur TaxID=280095 RepID=A0A2K8JL73_9HEMI|nr:venom serpin 3 [Lethocerus distinctifemur]